MRGIRAKKIRKECSFNVHKPREYWAMPIIGKKGRSKIIKADELRQNYQEAKKNYKKGK